MGEIIIEEVNYKAFVIALANFFLLVAFIAITVYGFREHKLRYWLPGLIAACVLLITLIGAIIKASQIRRLITITMDGIIDHSSISGGSFIPFEEIKEFMIVTVYNKQAIAVIPKNIESLLSKLSVVKRSLVKRNVSLNLPPITIFVDMAKDMEPEDILSLLQKRLADCSSLYS